MVFQTDYKLLTQSSVKPNTLSIAVASGRIGHVYLVDGEVRDWGVSVAASKSPSAARAKTEALLDIYRPDLVVTEKLSDHTRKSGRTIANVQAVEEAVQRADAEHIAVERIQRYLNKYLEMNALAELHPILASWVPTKRKLWESEDRRASIWEALAFVEQADL